MILGARSELLEGGERHFGHDTHGRFVRHRKATHHSCHVLEEYLTLRSESEEMQVSLGVREGMLDILRHYKH